MARWGFIAVGLVLMFIVAPFFWFGAVSPLAIYPPIVDPTAIALAWISGVAGLGLLIYGVVARSKR